MKSDYFDPADENWREVGDGPLWLAVKAGIPEAIAEAARRN